MMKSRICVTALVLMLLSSCSWFSKDDEVEEVKPAKLTRFAAEVQLDSLWNRKLGRGADDKAIKLMPAISGSRIFAASAGGKITAMQADSGRVIWEQKVQSFYSAEEKKNAFAEGIDVITGGVGVGADILVVGTAAGEIVAMNQSDGTLVWKARTTSEVLAPPQIDQELVIAQTIDGKLAAYNTLDGERKWLYSTLIPSLTLRGTSTPILLPEFIIASFANGHLLLLDRERGLAGMEERVAIPSGESDLDRLVDIDGTMIVDGNNLFAVSFQGRIIGVDLNQRRAIWANDASSVAGLGTGFGNIYLASADGTLLALDKSDGDEVWQVDALLHRELTAPVAMGSYLVVGDFEGYLHVIAQSDGRFVGRKRVDRDGILSPIIADGSRLFVQGNSGRLSAYELR